MRTTALLSVVLAACFPRAAAGATESPQTRGMNVLFIIIEDCNAGVWGCYGNSICQTPHLNQFATTAVQFDAAYVQAVSCNPSRTSFLSGLRPLTAGVWNNSQVMSEHLPEDAVTLPEMLKQGGFSTAVIGKFFGVSRRGRTRGVVRSPAGSLGDRQPGRRSALRRHPRENGPAAESGLESCFALTLRLDTGS